MPFPELALLFPASRLWFQAFVSVWNVLSPSVQIIPLQGPYPRASSTRKPSPGPLYVPVTPVPPVLLKVCPRLFPWPACICRVRTNGLFCVSSSPTCHWGWGAPCIHESHVFLECYRICPCSRTGCTVTQINSLCSCAPLFSGSSVPFSESTGPCG